MLRLYPEKSACAFLMLSFLCHFVGSFTMAYAESTQIRGTSNAIASSAGTSNAGTSNAGTSNAGTSNAGTSNAATSNAVTSNEAATNAGTSNAATSNESATDAGASNAATSNEAASNGGTSNAGTSNVGNLNAVTAQTASKVPLPNSWKECLEKAELLYQAGKYDEALALYEHASILTVSEKASAKDQVHCLRYLGDCYFRLSQYAETQKVLDKIEPLIPADDINTRVSNLNDQAACFDMQLDFDKAESICRTALKLCSDEKPETAWNLAKVIAHLAYISYLQGKYAAAIPGFQQSEKWLEKSQHSDLPAIVLKQKLAFAQAGSYYHLKRFEDAAKQFRHVYDIDVKLFGKTDLQTGWAMFAMSDVLGKIKQGQQAEDWYRKAIYVFRKYNVDRLYKEFASNPAAGADLKERISRIAFGESAFPADMKDDEPPICKDSSEILNTHELISLYARTFIDAPGRVWLNPFLKQKGVVIAIHGLSLQHSSYDALARQLAEQGYTTVAFDLRGFGTYRQALGAEQLDFDGCLRDLQLVVRAIKTDNPRFPIFMLGESMGGAIALQFAAQNPQLVDGLIASVPAGKRFNESRTALKVAVNYFEHKNRQFDIGTDVINQATHDPKLKEEWGKDPLTRNTLSANELIAFQLMCNRNLDFAKQISSTPVIMYQGVNDGLVKPEATYDLFRAIQSKDKSLVMIGNMEHLIFEEGCFTPTVLAGLLAWMDSHIKHQ